MQSAEIYKRGTKMIVHPTSYTIYGLGISAPPIEVFDASISPADLGLAVVEALGASRSEVPHPTDFPALARPFYDAAGVKSWSAFVKGSLSCTVDLDGSSLHINPWKNEGARKGFTPLPQQRLTLPASSPVEMLGQAVLDALKIAARAGED
jgi:hypothetical protein